MKYNYEVKIGKVLHSGVVEAIDMFDAGLGLLERFDIDKLPLDDATEVKLSKVFD